MSGIFLTVLSLPSIFFLRYRDEPNATTISPTSETEYAALVPSAPQDEDSSKTGLRVSWKQVLLLVAFWQYLLTALTSGASFAFNPYFYKLGQAFGKEQWELVRLFQVTEIIGTILGVAVAILTDVLHTKDGYGFSGSRNMSIGFLLVQTVLFVVCAIASSHNAFWTFLAAMCVLKVVMLCHEGVAALLAKDFFGTSNTVIVFGFGAGLSLGVGEGLSAWTMSIVESLARHSHAAVRQLTPDAYNPFYIAAAVYSFAGLLCATCMARPAIIFPKHSDSTYSSTI